MGNDGRRFLLTAVPSLIGTTCRGHEWHATGVMRAVAGRGRCSGRPGDAQHRNSVRFSHPPFTALPVGGAAHAASHCNQGTTPSSGRGGCSSIASNHAATTATGGATPPNLPIDRGGGAEPLAHSRARRSAGSPPGGAAGETVEQRRGLRGGPPERDRGEGCRERRCQHCPSATAAGQHLLASGGAPRGEVYRGSLRRIVCEMCSQPNQQFSGSGMAAGRAISRPCKCATYSGYLHSRHHCETRASIRVERVRAYIRTPWAGVWAGPVLT